MFRGDGLNYLEMHTFPCLGEMAWTTKRCILFHVRGGGLNFLRDVYFSLEYFEMHAIFILRGNGLDYLEMRLWIGVWTGAVLIVMVAFDLSALVRYITRFTEESFAALISLIFIVEAIVKLIRISSEYPINRDPDAILNYNCSCDLTNATLSPNISSDSIDKSNCTKFNGTLIGGGCDTPIYYPDIFLFSVLLFIGTFTLSYSLKMSRNASFFPTSVSGVLYTLWSTWLCECVCNASLDLLDSRFNALFIIFIIIIIIDLMLCFILVIISIIIIII